MDVLLFNKTVFQVLFRAQPSNAPFFLFVAFLVPRFVLVIFSFCRDGCLRTGKDEADGKGRGSPSSDAKESPLDFSQGFGLWGCVQIDCLLGRGHCCCHTFGCSYRRCCCRAVICCLDCRGTILGSGSSLACPPA